MKTYVVFVPGMRVASLARFTRQAMPSLEELLVEAKRRKVPGQCRACGTLLEEFVSSYTAVPSNDLTITFGRVSEGAVCYQAASGGGCNCRRIKERLRRIVQMHLAQKLREAGHVCSTHIY